MKKKLRINIECPETIIWEPKEGQERSEIEDKVRDYIKDLIYLYIREEETKE